MQVRPEDHGGRVNIPSVFSNETIVPSARKHRAVAILDALRREGVFSTDQLDFRAIFEAMLHILSSYNIGIHRGLAKTTSHADVHALATRLNDPWSRLLVGLKVEWLLALSNKELFSALLKEVGGNIGFADFRLQVSLKLLSLVGPSF